MEKILLDTDIGSDIDDAVCLAYLLARPDCDLLGITTVTGDVVKRAQMADAQCRVAGRRVPIYPGASQCLFVPQRQPDVPQAAALANWQHADSFPAGEAVEFLRRTIRANPREVTLLTIGPLTNIALLFAVDPEIPSLLKALVMMGGNFTPGARPNGYDEWNACVDPHATQMVFAARPPLVRAVGIEITTQCVMSADEVRRRFKSPLLAPVADFAGVWFEHAKEITFHDPLAAATIFDSSICQFDRGTVEVEFVDGTNPIAVRTAFNANATGNVAVATRVDSVRFFDHYFDTVG